MQKCSKPLGVRPLSSVSRRDFAWSRLLFERSRNVTSTTRSAGVFAPGLPVAGLPAAASLARPASVKVQTPLVEPSISWDSTNRWRTHCTKFHHLRVDAELSSRCSCSSAVRSGKYAATFGYRSRGLAVPPLSANTLRSGISMSPCLGNAMLPPVYTTRVLGRCPPNVSAQPPALL